MALKLIEKVPVVGDIVSLARSSSSKIKTKKNNKSKALVVYDPQAAAKASAGRKRRKARASTKGTGGSRLRTEGVKLRSNPTSMSITPDFSSGSTMSGVTFGVPQAHTDRTTNSSEGIRVFGRERFVYHITANTSGQMGFALGTSGSVATNVPLAPNEISTRLGTMESIFQYYAIRELKLHWVTTQATTYAGAITMGVDNADKDDSTNWADGLNATTVSQLANSSNFNLYAQYAKVFDYSHKGTSVFLCDADNTGKDASTQAVLYCFGEGYATPGATLVVGYFMCEYVVDFYFLSPKQAAPDRLRKSASFAAPLLSEKLNYDEKSAPKVSAMSSDKKSTQQCVKAAPKEEKKMAKLSNLLDPKKSEGDSVTAPVRMKRQLTVGTSSLLGVSVSGSSGGGSDGDEFELTESVSSDLSSKS